MKAVISRNELQTKKIAYDFAGKIEPGTVVCMFGDLGSGKTTFVQGFAKFFQIEKIVSPTFVLMRRYKINIFGYNYFYHFDLYRLNNIEEINLLGISELMQEKDNLIVIEWAEKLNGNLPKKRLDVNFTFLSENQRKITFCPYLK